MASKEKEARPVIKPKGLTLAHTTQSNIPEDYWDCDFSNYQGPTDAKTKVTNYLRELDVYKLEGVGFTLAGPHGPGKTTLAMITLKYLARANWNVYATSLGEIVETIQRNWKEHEPDTELIDRTKTADFILIDDVGKEHRGGSGFVSTVFDNLIRYRVQHRLPTFLTTNYTKSELKGSYGESIISLLSGKNFTIEVAGDDHRTTVQRQNLKNRL